MLAAATILPLGKPHKMCLDDSCLARMDQRGLWHSQFRQDRHVWHLLGRMSDGYFVDLAANEPVQLSNTRALERDHGWRGVCVEPNPQLWPALRRVRSCNLATVAVGREESVLSFELNGAFSKVRTRNVSAANTVATRQMRMDQLLIDHRTPSTIDYLSLDVEGHEMAALSTFPFGRTRIRVLTVERPSEELRALLRGHGYQHVCDHGMYGDEMWAHGSGAGVPGLPRCKRREPMAAARRAGRVKRVCVLNKTAERSFNATYHARGLAAAYELERSAPVWSVETLERRTRVALEDAAGPCLE